MDLFEQHGLAALLHDDGQRHEVVYAEHRQRGEDLRAESWVRTQFLADLAQSLG
ncbi:MAG: hypothetical protein OEM00_02070 [Burkholderiaceae bacterium]|nr:hypothetical protein [Burkholderiaceae bacterium]MDH3459762.1 hypothetical protein [Burkholderiaceae bacterium]